MKNWYYVEVFFDDSEQDSYTDNTKEKVVDWATNSRYWDDPDCSFKFYSVEAKELEYNIIPPVKARVVFI